jgi:DNA uptake protein ComE-like DNA-binding protein
MNMSMKAVVIAASLLLSAAVGFAAEPKAPVKDAAGVVKADLKGAKESAAAKVADVKAKLVDINSALEAELKAIPGIGDAYAAKIIAGRPYANKTQLKSRKIIPSNVYETIKEKIIAKQAQK